jgi:DNA-binding NarL/FixJ family response regulator
LPLKVASAQEKTGFFVVKLIGRPKEEEATVQTTRTLIVDDDGSFRRRVKGLLASERDIEVIGEAGDGQEAILKARELEPDLVLMDVRMPGMNGVNATRQLKNEMPELKVLILTIFDLQEYREAAIASGASGYVIKKSLIEELMPAIRGVLGSP